MSHAKETPRQKMIGLMYLVLTCLLALNVSKEVLEGFVTINESIETTNTNFTDNNNKMLDAINEAIKHGRNEFIPYYEKSKKVTVITQRIFDYIDTLKKELIKYTEDKKGADTLKLGFVEKLDELNLDGVEPLLHMSSEVNVLREDEIKGSISRSAALKNAPLHDDQFFKVPKVIKK